MIIKESHQEYIKTFYEPAKYSNCKRFKLVEIYFRCRNEEEELERKYNSFINFYEFNKSTGLGRKYKQLKLKIRILIRILEQH